MDCVISDLESSPTRTYMSDSKLRANILPCPTNMLKKS